MSSDLFNTVINICFIHFIHLFYHLFYTFVYHCDLMWPMGFNKVSKKCMLNMDAQEYDCLGCSIS